MAEPARLLVVDDDENVSVTIQAVLEQEGYAVRTALTAGAARKLFNAEQFDAALLDLRLDDADGIEVLQELRLLQPHCSAIMLTGYASLESAVRAIRQGAYDYLMKPCDLDELKLTIARAIERGRLVRSLNERIEELQTANATIRGFSDELQQRVDEATAELSLRLEELGQAKRALEKTQQHRKEFISMMAHELGQPLTSIIGNAQLMGRPNRSPEAQERARTTIVTEAHRLKRLVQDLAEEAQVAAGRFPVHPANCDLAAIVREQVELAQVNARRHTLCLDAAAGAVPVFCDRDRVVQVLSNLVTNAMKYTPGGKIRVSLRVENDQTLISVSDEGPGIPRDQLEAIFEPHVRLAGPKAGGETKGSGLGLYISKGIIEAHKGQIWAESKEGRGSTFTLSLPLMPE